MSTYLRPFRALGVAPPAAPPVPKVRRLTSWMLRHPDDIDSDDQVTLKQALLPALGHHRGAYRCIC